MDSTDAATPSHPFEPATRVPIAELRPDLPDPATTAVGGVVTITWPYNKVNGTFAFSLAEPDFRRRRHKGQVRIEFTGRAARTVGDSGLGSNDEVLLSLAGAAWEIEVANKRRSLPGAELGWKLIFSERLLLKITRAETGETDIIVVDEQPNHHDETPESSLAQPLAVVPTVLPPTPLSPVHIASPPRERSRKRSPDAEFASPAFVKRARMSYGSLFEDGFDIFADAGIAPKTDLRRSVFGRDSTSWRYTSRSPSPEPVATTPDFSSPTRPASSPTRARMTDEGCQTMDLDRSSPPPDSASFETHADETTTKHSPEIEAHPEPTNLVLEPMHEPSPNDVFSSTAKQHMIAPNFSEPHAVEVHAPVPYLGGQLNPPQERFAGSPWIANVVPDAFIQNKIPFQSFQGVETLAPPNFEDAAPRNQPTPLDEADACNIPRLGDDEPDESLNHDPIHEAGLLPPVSIYPPLEPVEGIPPRPANDEALANYPSSYLEGGYTSHGSPMMEEQPWNKRAVAEMGPTSWAAINQTSNTNTTNTTARLGSRSGATPEEAFVINEGDSESEPEPEPMAVEDTVNNGCAYVLDEYEDVEVEDEDDAQYSDDDEPEYDPEEMGGDYDTREYERPADDDDGYDQDPQPHNLEPEFEEGENWDEEDEEEEVEDESDYESDEEVPEPVPPPVVRTNPTVIDLLSSSEDESENENDAEIESFVEEEEGDDVTGMQRSGTHINSRSSPRYQNLIPMDTPQIGQMDDDIWEIVSQGPLSEVADFFEASVDGRGHIISDEEDSEEDGEDVDEGDIEYEDQDRKIGKGIVSESYEYEEVTTYELSKPRAEQQPDLGDQLGRQTEPNSDAKHGEISDDEAELISEAKPFGNTLLKDDTEETPEQAYHNMSLSAADGLEMLSRAVDEESNASKHGVFSKSIVEKVVVETIPAEHIPAEPREEEDVQMQDLVNSQLQEAIEAVEEVMGDSSRQDHEEDEGSQTTPSKVDAEKQTRSIGHTEAADDAPLSFPSSPLQSQTVEVPTSTSAADLATTSFPLQDTQITDTTLDTSINTHMTMAQSFDSYTTVEQQDDKPSQGPFNENPVGNSSQHNVNVNVNVNEHDISHGRGSTLIVELEARKPEIKPASSSPAPSFQSQVDDGGPAWHADEDQTEIDNQLTQEAYGDFGFDEDESDASESYVSQMDIDEEFQASILESSLLEEEEQVSGNLNEEIQARILEDSLLEQEEDGNRFDDELQAGMTVDSPLEAEEDSDKFDEELQASILEDSLLEEERDEEDGDSNFDEEFQASILENSLLEEVDSNADDDFQASILENSLPEDDNGHDFPDEVDKASQVDTDETSPEPEHMNQADTATSPLHDQDPAKKLDGVIDEADQPTEVSTNEVSATVGADQAETASPALHDYGMSKQLNDVHDEPGEPSQAEADTDKNPSESEPMSEREMPVSSHDDAPEKQLTEELSDQLRRNFITHSRSASENSDTSMANDPSVQLARVANAADKPKKKHAASSRQLRPRRKTLEGRTLDVLRSPTPDTDDQSIRLARASLGGGSQTPRSDDESETMTTAKLQLARHLRDEIPDFCSLEGLRQHVTKTLDVIAVAAMQPPKTRRAKNGPREYMMSFTITDYSIGPYNVAEALLYRPHKESLPVIKYGDVVLFRNFTVVSLAGKGYGLRSNAGSSWAVFDYAEEPAQIRGPPVEYIQREITYVNYLREWFYLIEHDEKARARLESSNQDFISASASAATKSK
ncbi:hypothetical protein F4808DRAFT_138331 [Astrocystis sublimbata]|nr:hypothetical protein F4808DRAFT_138331 [Astrocystis sublimbata]